MRRGAAALGAKCGNGQHGGAGDNRRIRGKGGKRKQVDSDQQESENQPPQKKPPTRVPGKNVGKNISKAQSKKKLIAGQGKLTSFFRV